jgi:Protein of unknown function (DUF421)
VHAAAAELRVGRLFRAESPVSTQLIEGQPSLLVHDGQVIESHMAKEHVSMDELHRTLREHGISSVDQVALPCWKSMDRSGCLKYDEIRPDANTHLAAGRRRFIQKKP